MLANRIGLGLRSIRRMEAGAPGTAIGHIAQALWAATGSVDTGLSSNSRPNSLLVTICHLRFHLLPEQSVVGTGTNPI